MTADTGQLPVRVAEHHGTCLNCDRGISPGQHIVKDTGRAWRHEDCTKARRARGGRKKKRPA
jgi:hypothetical protein